MITYKVVTIYGVMSLDSSIFVIHITGDFQKMRGVVRSAILATAGLFSKQTPNSEFVLVLERKWGGCGFGARTQSLRGGYWDSQKLILPEGGWSH